MEEWYYVNSGQQQGPVSLEKLREMAANGSLQASDLVWNTSMKDWAPAGVVSGIFSSRPPQLATGAASATDQESTAHASPVEEIPPGSDPVDISDCLNRTVELTKKHFSTLIILGLICFGVSAVLSVVINVAQMVGGALASTQGSNGEAITIGIIAFVVVAQIIAMVANLYLSLGMTRACLNLADGKTATPKTLFGESDKLLRAFGASILCALIVIVGMIMLIVPGIYFAIKLSATIPAIVDRNMRVTEAMSYSYSITTNNCWPLIGLWIIAVIAALAIIVVTCGTGAIIANPIITLCWIISYRWMQFGKQSTLVRNA